METTPHLLKFLNRDSAGLCKSSCLELEGKGDERR